MTTKTLHLPLFTIYFPHTMNYIRHLNAFFSHIKQDKKITASHVSLYLALFQYWNLNRFDNPFPIYREKIMQLSKIGSKNTYHKCIRELHQARYIFYHANTSRYRPVKISMVRLDKQEEKKPQQLDLFSGRTDKSPSTENGTCTYPKNGTPQVPILTDTSPDNGTANVPNPGQYIKQVKHKQLNSVLNSNTPTEIFKKNEALSKKINGLAQVPKPVHETQHQTSPLSTCGESLSRTNGRPGERSLSQIESFFLENGFPITEAQKFFYYNQSKNWMLSENIPITDWEPLALKWMLNNNNKTKKDQHDKPSNVQQHLNPGSDKDYSQPL
ncbi:MAG: hypothetical protein JST58_05300 [Bacteroidetes bacterium]|nr:hypothetical protein [Bacteroidota bacterium]